MTTPGFKKPWRFYSRETGQALADYVALHNEAVDDTGAIVIFDPDAVWKRKRLENFRAEELLAPIFKRGELVYELPRLPDIQAYCLRQIDNLWDEVKRFENPHRYYVDLSQQLWDMKQQLLHEVVEKSRVEGER